MSLIHVWPSATCGLVDQTVLAHLVLALQFRKNILVDLISVKGTE